MNAVRRAVPFDLGAAMRGDHFWPLARAARALGACTDFPPVGTLTRVFEGEAPVRFVVAAPRRRRREPLQPHTLYDARITLEREVPTRERSWHDLMNALVWGTFPRAKLALHARQHRAIAARIAPDSPRLPPCRTRELDALALLDEGGVVVLARDPARVRAALGAGALRDEVAGGSADALVFGHAIYESLALGVVPAVVAAVVVLHDREGRGPGDLVDAADEGLARIVEDDALLSTPVDLKRVELKGLAPAR